MVSSAKSRKFRKSRSQVLHNPGGVIHPRVQAVDPQHFAILCVDCAKNRYKIMLADFYGLVLLQPTTVKHDRPGFQAAIKQVRDRQARHNIKDMIVVVERTGGYHRPIQHAFAKASFEVRVLHPDATKKGEIGQFSFPERISPVEPGLRTIKLGSRLFGSQRNIGRSGRRIPGRTTLPHLMFANGRSGCGQRRTEFSFSRFRILWSRVSSV
jgi:hypothetical protein